MRMERGDAGVGLTVIGGVVAVAALWFWLGSSGTEYFALFVEYDQVDALTPQTPVRLQGFTVGRIQEIRPRSTESGAVVFRVELRVEDRFLGDSALSIPRGTVARVQHPPVVGSPFIVLEPPAEGGEPLESGAEIPGLRTEPFLDQIQVLTGQLSFTVTQTLMRATTLMDSLEGTLGRMDRTITVAEAGVPDVLANLNASIVAAERLTRRVESELDLTTPALRASLDSTTALVTDSRRLVQDTEALLATTRPRAEVILANLDSATWMLSYLAGRLAEKPLRVFTGVGPVPPRPPRGADTIPPGG